MYASSLAEELGLKPGPYEIAGRTNGELFMATRALVETGIHLKGWTREDADLDRRLLLEHVLAMEFRHLLVLRREGAGLLPPARAASLRAFTNCQTCREPRAKT
jgi:hypothetical protein